MKLKTMEKIQRALGYIEGICHAVPADIAEALMRAVEMVDVAIAEDEAE